MSENAVSTFTVYIVKYDLKSPNHFSARGLAALSDMLDLPYSLEQTIIVDNEGHVLNYDMTLHEKNGKLLEAGMMSNANPKNSAQLRLGYEGEDAILYQIVHRREMAGDDILRIVAAYDRAILLHDWDAAIIEDHHKTEAKRIAQIAEKYRTAVWSVTDLNPGNKRFEEHLRERVDKMERLLLYENITVMENKIDRLTVSSLEDMIRSA